MIDVVNYKLSMCDTLNTFVKDAYAPYGNVFCPFHPNENTPSAKIYEGERGDFLMCFSERKAYRPADVFLKGLAPISLEDIFHHIWNDMTEQEKVSLSVVIANPKTYQIKGLECLDGFRLGKMTYDNFLEVFNREILKKG